VGTGRIEEGWTWGGEAVTFDQLRKLISNEQNIDIQLHSHSPFVFNRATYQDLT
jgi:hypothetical protein